MDALALASTLGISTAAGTTIGTVLTTYFTSGNDRREKRSAVFQHIAILEAERWVDQKTLDATERGSFAYAQKLRALETAALLAQLPREVVVHYVILAQTAYSLSAESVQSEKYDESQGFIDAKLADAVTRAAVELINSVWKPRRARLRQKSRVKKLEQQVRDEVRDETLKTLEYFSSLQGKKLPKKSNEKQ